MIEFEVALDWTPNTNHLGIYVAEAAGYYDDAGLDVTIRSPLDDDYGTTPAKRVATGDATVAIAPSESAISYNTHPDYPSLRSIAAVCQRDTSAIVALGDSAIERPADLDGRTYASYDARFEDDIVRQLIRNDGGDGDVDVVTPPKLGIWETLLDGVADTTWVFMPWEGLLAERDGVSLTTFYVDDYDVPYGYTPVMVARPDTVEDDSESVAAFLDATARGYRESVADPAAAAETLHTVAEGPDLDDREFLEASARCLAPNVLTSNGEWGTMAASRWETFVDWLASQEILTTLDGDHLPASELDVEALYTNALLPSNR